MTWHQPHRRRRVSAIISRDRKQRRLHAGLTRQWRGAEDVKDSEVELQRPTVRAWGHFRLLVRRLESHKLEHLSPWRCRRCSRWRGCVRRCTRPKTPRSGRRRSRCGPALAWHARLGHLAPWQLLSARLWRLTHLWPGRALFSPPPAAAPVWHQHGVHTSVSRHPGRVQQPVCAALRGVVAAEAADGALDAVAPGEFPGMGGHHGAARLDTRAQCSWPCSWPMPPGVRARSSPLTSRPRLAAAPGHAQLCPEPAGHPRGEPGHLRGHRCARRMAAL